MPAAPTPPPRRASVDAYRGFVMLLLLGEALQLRKVADALPESGFWAVLAFHQSHVPWAGCALHDLIQPSFSFLVGVACVFSLAKRRDRPSARWRLPARTLWRAAVLIGLGVWLRSLGKPRTNWTFEDTLTQIGLGYPALVWLGTRSVRVQCLALATILVGCWVFFAAHPMPTPDAFDYPSVGVPDAWPHNPTGFAARWAKNSNAAWAFDGWFLNLFPRPEPFRFNRGGYCTLNFVPTLGTMALGLLAGRVLRAGLPHRRTLAVLAGTGVALLAAGSLLGAAGVCPVVKRVWTPTWVLFSGGWCFLLLAVFHLTTDAVGRPGWSLPLRVVGANSILAYASEWLLVGPLRSGLRAVFGDGPFRALGDAYEPLLSGAAVLAVVWAGLYTLYRLRLFVRL